MGAVTLMHGGMHKTRHEGRAHVISAVVSDNHDATGRNGSNESESATSMAPHGAAKHDGESFADEVAEDLAGQSPEA